MKPGRDRAGQVWALDNDTLILVLRSEELDDSCSKHAVVVLATDKDSHNWKVGVEMPNWLERFVGGQGWGEGDSKRRRIA